MSSNPQNNAAFIESERAHPFVVKPAAFPKPAPNEVIVKTAAVAINPIDYKLQAFPFFPLAYPTIFGCDVAGTVHQLGSDVPSSLFKPGDHVAARAVGAFFTGDNRSSGFQSYVAVPVAETVRIPEGMTFESVSVLPVCFSTAAAGLFLEPELGMQLPSLDPKPTGRTVLIWGGSSSVGSNAIQLSKAAGYMVATTASARNAAYCKRLGADVVFDHGKEGVVEEIVAALKGQDVIGAFDCIALESTYKPCAEVIAAVAPGKKLLLTHPGLEGNSTDKVQFTSVMASQVTDESLAEKLYHDFLPKALGAGKYLAKPDADVIGRGLEMVQAGVDKSKAGVSASKIVISI